jgi:hypothetical protein
MDRKRKPPTKNKTWLPVLIALVLLITACQSASLAQKGKWTASLQPNTNVTWTLIFSVDANGKQIASGALLNFGKTSTVLLQPVDIKNNQFKLSFQYMNGFALSTYEFDGAFTSVSTAAGTVDIGGKNYQWTAAPAGS